MRMRKSLRKMDNGNLLLTESIRKVLTRLKRYLLEREGKPNAYYPNAPWANGAQEGFVPNRLLTCWPRCWEYDDYLEVLVEGHVHEDIADQLEAMLHLERHVMALDSDLIDNVFPESGVWGPLVIESSTMARRELEVKLPDLNDLPSQVAVALRLEEHIDPDPSPHTGMEFCRELTFILTGPTAWKGSVTIRLDMKYRAFRLRYDGGSGREDDDIASQVDAIVAFVLALVAVDLPLETRMKLTNFSTYQTEKLKAEMQKRHEREGLQQLGLEFCLNI